MPNFNVGEWLDFMPDEVVFTAKTGQTVTGSPIYGGTPVTYQARIEMRNHLTVDSKGRTITARGKVFLGTTTAPDIEDQITLPGRFEPVHPPVLAINAQSDENGTHHVTVEIG